MSKYGDRFIITEKQGGSLKESGLMKVIVDRETGVNYLFIHSGHAGGAHSPAGRRGKALVPGGQYPAGYDPHQPFPSGGGCGRDLLWRPV